MFPDVPIISINIRDFEEATYCNKLRLWHNYKIRWNNIKENKTFAFFFLYCQIVSRNEYGACFAHLVIDD
jgi:hypothetical protein